MEMQIFFSSRLLFALFLILIQYKIVSSNDENDLILSLSEKETLERFKELMRPKLVHDYMKKDVFLIRWLRAKDFDIEEASHLLEQNLKWRQEENIDNIEEEDWSYFEQEYPILTNVTDIDGRPTIVTHVGEWDIRKVAISGQSKKFQLWVAKAFENVDRQVRNLQNQGKNVTRWNALFNLDKFTATSVCLQCLPIYTNVAKILELDYPHSASKLWLLNSPTVFNVVLNIVRPILSPSTNAAVKAFARTQWETLVFQKFEKSQLPIYLKGNPNDNLINRVP